MQALKVSHDLVEALTQLVVDLALLLGLVGLGLWLGLSLSKLVQRLLCRVHILVLFNDVPFVVPPFVNELLDHVLARVAGRALQRLQERK